jgi:3-phenylpropionate/trans-cinnamate dioxygenase ferredoxin subunit
MVDQEQSLENEHTRRFFRVGLLNDITDPGVKVFNAGKQRILVARCDGHIYAMDDRCTHDNGPLGEGELDGCEIECPRHGARFDVKTGKALCLPAVGSVRTYSVEVREGEIYVGLPTNAQS